MSEDMRGPVGMTGLRGEPGDPGPRGASGPRGDCFCERESWRPMLEKEYPHGWEKNSHAGIRGTWGAVSETELLEHLIYWLQQCQIGEPSMSDPAGNAYYGVDSNVVKQTLESLRRYRRLLTEPLGKQLTTAARDTGEVEQMLDSIFQ